MKKLTKILLTLFFCFCFCLPFFAFCDTKANAEELTNGQTEEIDGETDGETDDTTGENGQTEEETETEEKIVLSREELQEIINNALSENQKNIVDKVSTFISEKLNVAKGNVALIVSSCVLVGGLVIFFVGKYIAKKRKIAKDKVAMQALADEAQTYKKQSEDYLKLLEQLSKTNFADVIEKGIKDIEEDIHKNLKLDSNVVGKLLKDIDIQTALTQHVLNALKIVLTKSGNVAAVNELSIAPETAVVERLEYENAKLKETLGDEAVKKILGE